MLKRKRKRTVKLGERHVETRGLSRHFWQDIFHTSMTGSWLGFFAAAILIFLGVNVFFAVLYALDPDGIANRSTSDPLAPFYFAVETFSTVGFGDMHPIDRFTHWVVTLELMVGMSCNALLTGIIFARFSRPHARILFAKHPVIRRVGNQLMLEIRAANARQNYIIDASAKLRIIRVEHLADGTRIRLIRDLKLVRDQHPQFILGWNLMHYVDEQSPLWDQTPDQLKENRTALILTLTGIDENTGQSLTSRHNYTADSIRWHHRYVDVLHEGPNGLELIDYTLFHDTRALGESGEDLDAGG